MMAAAKAGLVLVTINTSFWGGGGRIHPQARGCPGVVFHGTGAHLRPSGDPTYLDLSPGVRHGEVTSERLPRLRFLCLMGMPPAGLLEQEGWRPTLLGEVSARGRSGERYSISRAGRSRSAHLIPPS